MGSLTLCASMSTGVAAGQTQKAAKKRGFNVVGSVQGKVVETKATSAAKQAAQVNLPVERPKLNDILRKFWKLVHPDLFSQFPEQRKINEQSMMIFQGYLSAIKDPSGDAEYPKFRNKRIVFILRTQTPGHFLRAPLILHSSGSDKGNASRSLREFFRLVGLAEDFEWDEEYWPLKGNKTMRSEAEEEAMRQAEEEAEGNVNESYEDFMNRMKAKAERQQQA